MRNRLSFLLMLIFFTFPSLADVKPQANKKGVVIYSAPLGEELNKSYKVSVGKRTVPVYNVKVAPENDIIRAKAMDDKINSEKFYSTAALAYFDLHGKVTVTIAVATKISEVKILPLSAGIRPVINNKSLSFEVTSAKNLTIEINNEWVKSLHLFINPPDLNPPKIDDPNVIYFGPGIHEISSMVIDDNKTVYVAGGAIVRCVVKPNEKFIINNKTGLRYYPPTFDLRGRNITFRGRGIIDQSKCMTNSRSIISVHKARSVKIEGVIFKDASLWTIPIRQSNNIYIDNVKLLGYRANSDGIDIINSQEVTVQNCFIRTLDDLIVIKSDKGGGEVKSVKINKCILWNQLAHALSIGAEVRENISDITFSNCDIVHDQGREWLLRIYHSDAATVKNVRFEDIRVEQGKKLISVWIGKGIWSRDQGFGRIKNVLFKNIVAYGSPLSINLVGADTASTVDSIIFKNVKLNDSPINSYTITKNSYVKRLSILN